MDIALGQEAQAVVSTLPETKAVSGLGAALRLQAVPGGSEAGLAPPAVLVGLAGGMAKSPVASLVARAVLVLLAASPDPPGDHLVLTLLGLDRTLGS